MRSRKRAVRYGLLTANIALLLAVVIFVTQEPASTNGLQLNAVGKVANNTAAATSPLDQLSSADIAVHVAQVAGLDPDEVVAARNEADSQQLQLSLAPTDNAVVIKPQIVSTELKSKDDIITYVAKEGDSVSSVARAHDVTSESVRWSNNLSGNTLTVGQKLVIPPVDGIVYTVKSGDTIDGLVQRFNANKAQLIADNNAELGGLKIGARILIRGGVQSTPRVSSGYGYGGFAFGFRAVYGYNGYSYGYCTWYVANKRSIPANWGNAYSWDEGARVSGFKVGRTPRAGSILQYDGGRGMYAGVYHVAYVERVFSDGSVEVSEMNARGWAVVSRQTISAATLRNADIEFIY